jgi:hypothetical protein
MEVDSDDDLLEVGLNEARSKGPLPDITTSNMPLSSNGSGAAANLSTITTRTYQNNFLKKESANGITPHAAGVRLLRQDSENQPLLTNDTSHLSDDQAALSDFVHLSCNHFDDDPEFNEKIKQVEFAIDHNILPQRIYEGSSGSYFAKNSEYVVICCCCAKIWFILINLLIFYWIWTFSRLFAYKKENCSRFQAKRRGTVRHAQSEMDKMAAQNMLSVLLWSLLFGAKSGLFERSGREHSRRKAWLKNSA